MSSYVLVNSGGEIVNRIVVDGPPDWAAPEGFGLVADAGDEFQIGGTYFDGVYTPAAGPPAAPVDLVAYAKDASWRKEVGGIVIAGIPVATDDRSQLKILGSRVAADADPNWSTDWDAANDQTFPIDAATMIMISDAVAAHVNRCFSIRATVKAAIAAGTVTTTTEIDVAFA